MNATDGEKGMAANNRRTARPKTGRSISVARAKKERLLTGEKQGLGKGGVAPPKKYQWKKGCPSPNPSGRPKQVLTDEIRKLLPLPYPLDRRPADWNEKKQGKWEQKTWAEALALSLASNTLKGNAAALNQLYNRLEGKVPLVLQGLEGGPMQMQFNIKKLSDKELDMLEKIMEKAAEPERGPPS